MKRTTVYLPAELKRSLKELAQSTGRAEAEIIRDAIASEVERSSSPRPRLPLTRSGLGDPDAAEKVEELLRGFGRR